MKKAIYSLASLVCGAMLLCTTSASGASANVKFGKPDQNNSNCAGKGVCMLSNDGGAEGSVAVDFTYVGDQGDGLSTLTMQFSISEMEASDSEYLYQYFLTAKGAPRASYSFDAPYRITNAELCSELGIAPGAVTISPSNASTIEKISGTHIRVTYKIP